MDMFDGDLVQALDYEMKQFKGNETLTISNDLEKLLWELQIKWLNYVQFVYK